MEDEQVAYEPEPQQQRQIEVVGYDMVRSTVEGVAEDAAKGAADAVASRVEVATEGLAGTVDEVATKAAEGAATRVVAAQSDRGDTNTSDVPQTVALTDSQYQWMQDSMRIQSATSVLTLLVCCSLLGVLLVQIFVERWRR